MQPGPVLAPLWDCFLTSKMMQHSPMMQPSPSNNSLESSGKGRSENPDPEVSGKSGFRMGRQKELAPGHPSPPHTHTHIILGAVEECGGQPATSPRQQARMSQSLTHDSKHTPPCVMHTFTLTHAATTLPTPLLSAGLPQQRGCAGAGVLSELARQVFPLQEKPSGFC